ncbi:MAG TPA: DinB family protein [Dehalococcoidia bacterium]|nr:DinB family protein [Dehalococcoidia bacterium]
MSDTVTARCPICDADVERPRDTVAGMAAAPAATEAAFRAPGASAAAGWSRSEVAAHLADVEIGLAWRLRQTLAEDEPEIQPFDQDAWATATHYPERDAEASLRAYAAVRAVNVEIMRRMTEAEWVRRFRHREFGDLPIQTLIEHIADHDLAHLRQLRGK